MHNDYLNHLCCVMALSCVAIVGALIYLDTCMASSETEGLKSLDSMHTSWTTELARRHG